MKKTILWKCMCMMAMLLVMSANAGAQDLKSILSGVAKAVVGDKATTETSIIGTWEYVSPACQFESESLLAKAGGEVAAKEIEEKLQTVYEKVGMDGCQYTFKDDKTYSTTFSKRSVTGSYTFDNEAKTVTMSTKLGIKMVAHVTVTGNSMSLVFDADKLMSVLKTLTNAASSLNSTASTLNTLLNSYDGMMLGFELQKK